MNELTQYQRIIFNQFIEDGYGLDGILEEIANEDYCFEESISEDDAHALALYIKQLIRDNQTTKETNNDEKAKDAEYFGADNRYHGHGDR